MRDASYKRILVVQDISCVGQCSLTVALPILSACGMETAILPSAVLSTHTAGDFKGYTFRDLTDDIPAILDHWMRQGITFDALYTGYLGSTRQVEMVERIMDTLIVPGGVKIVDPAMADNGKLYAGFDDEYVAAMRRLCARADIILPNITEAAMLTEQAYSEKQSEEYISGLLIGLADISNAAVVLTGVSYDSDKIGALSVESGEARYYSHRRIPRMFHGTGDVYASAFTGAYLRGHSLHQAAAIAVDFTSAAIENTVDAPEHWYGVRFEPVLPMLIERLSQKE
jgi:pyridoxine kinase